MNFAAIFAFLALIAGLNVLAFSGVSDSSVKEEVRISKILLNESKGDSGESVRGEFVSKDLTFASTREKVSILPLVIPAGSNGEITVDFTEFDGNAGDFEKSPRDVVITVEEIDSSAPESLRQYYLMTAGSMGTTDAEGNQREESLGYSKTGHGKYSMNVSTTRSGIVGMAKLSGAESVTFTGNGRYVTVVSNRPFNYSVRKSAGADLSNVSVLDKELGEFKDFSARSNLLPNF